MVPLEHGVATLVCSFQIGSLGSRPDLLLSELVQLVAHRVELSDGLPVVAVKLLHELCLLAESILILLHEGLIRPQQSTVLQKLCNLVIDIACLAEFGLLRCLDLVNSVLRGRVQFHDPGKLPF